MELEMQAELAREQAHLRDLKGYLNDTAPDVIASNNRIKALREQAAVERTRLTDQEAGDLNELNARFQDLKLDLEFAVDSYQSSMLALEKARVEASKKLKHLVVITTPAKAEEAMYPQRLYILSSLMAALLLLYWLGAMLIATINEHSEYAGRPT